MNALAATPSLRPAAAARPAAPAKLSAYMPMLMATLLAGSYTVRGTLLPYLGGERINSFTAMAALAGLAVAALYVLIGGVMRLSVTGCVIIAATGLSLWGCERFEFSLPRWVGWCVLMVAAGPVFTSAHAIRFRHEVTAALHRLFVLVVIASAVWRLAGLPRMGLGDFSGVMWHALLLGPMAAMVAVAALVRAFRNDSAPAYALFATATFVTFWSSSRASVAGLALAVAVAVAMRLKRRPFVSAMLLGLVVTTVAAPSVTLKLGSLVVPESMLTGLLRKSFEHSRERHWEARWDEFYSSPYTGIGFVSAWEGSAGVDADTGLVETGSSYLSVLSMTGSIGAGAFALGLLITAWRLKRRWRSLPEPARVEICSMGAFWAVHLGAEGYIYAVGSLLGLAFWAWWATVNDVLRAPAVAAQSRPKPTTARPVTNLRPRLQPRGTAA